MKDLPMRQLSFLAVLLPVLFVFAPGCGSDTSPTIVEGPVMDNGGMSPEELNGETPAEETSGEY